MTSGPRRCRCEKEPQTFSVRGHGEENATVGRRGAAGVGRRWVESSLCCEVQGYVRVGYSRGRNGGTGVSESVSLRTRGHKALRI